MAIDISTHKLVKTIYVVAIIHIVVSFFGSIWNLSNKNKPVIGRDQSTCESTYKNQKLLFWGVSVLACLVLTISSGIVLFDHFKDKPLNAAEQITKNQVIALFSLSLAHLLVSVFTITCIKEISSGIACDIVQGGGWILSFGVIIALVILSKHVLDKV